MRKCDVCGTEFKPTNNRNKFCKPCRAERKRCQDRKYKQEARSMKDNTRLCECGATYVVLRNSKRCDKCITKSKIIMEAKTCETDGCTNKLQRRSLKFCPECKEVKRVAAIKKQVRGRRACKLLLKHETSDGEDKPPTKFTTRGKITYRGYMKL